MSAWGTKVVPVAGSVMHRCDVTKGKTYPAARFGRCTGDIRHVGRCAKRGHRINYK